MSSTLLLFFVAMNPPRLEGQSCSNVAGSPFYMSPEQRAGLPIQRNQAQKIDMFAVGVVFFELYCPFTTEMERHTVSNKYTLSSTFAYVLVVTYIMQVLTNLENLENPKFPPRFIDKLHNEVKNVKMIHVHY